MIVRQRAGVLYIVFVDPKGLAVVPVEAVLGPEPHKARPILVDGGDIALRKTLLETEALETNGPPLTLDCDAAESQADQNEQES